MGVVTPRSEVVSDAAGWTWLQPVESSTRARHTAGTFVLAVLILAGMATSTLLPLTSAVPATAVVVAAAGWLVAAIVRGAASRLALSDLGLYVQDGARVLQVAWTAVEAVTARPAGGRWRIHVDDGHRPRTTRAAFETPVARAWLELATAEARRRRLEPEALPNGRGFTARRHSP